MLLSEGLALKEQPKAKHLKSLNELSREERLELYSLMYLSRHIDDVEIQLKAQNKTFFQISGAGHEATLLAASKYLKPGYDWFFPYYRDRALCLGLGVSPLDMLYQAVGSKLDKASGGRQMPNHWGNSDLHIVSQSSVTGTQFGEAIGSAEAGKLWAYLETREHRFPSGTEHLKSQHKFKGVFAEDEVIYVSGGDGSTSQGIFFEALNSACLGKLPIIFHIEDNEYAISVPIEVQTAGGSISKLVQNYPDLLCLEFDGCDLNESLAAWKQGVHYARTRQGPVLLHAHVIRPYSHSLSDDEKFYRNAEELALQAARDPLKRYKHILLHEYQVSAPELTHLEEAIIEEVKEYRQKALNAPLPDTSKESILRYVYADTPATSLEPPELESFTAIKVHEQELLTPHEPKTMVDLLNMTLHDEMARDERILIFGEDVADVSRSSLLNQLKGKGGVFKVTHGLQRLFGDQRVFNTPLAEAGIIARAMGLAERGFKPVIEIQFFDYIWVAMMQIRNEVANMRWRSYNDWSCPLVIRAPYGGYLKGGSIYHSQTGESLMAHIPGLKVVMPATALDASGLLRAAIRSEDPVLFLEHKHLYRQTYNRSPYPGPDYSLPLGKAKVVRSGQTLTIITYGALVKKALDAAEIAFKQTGIDPEILDLRTISPYDFKTISESVQKTGKALVLHEDNLTFGAGAEIAAKIGEELFEYLDGPVCRLASLDTFVAYNPQLEEVILPQTEDILAAINKLARY